MGIEFGHGISSGSQRLRFQCFFTIGSGHFRRNNTIEVFFQIHHIHCCHNGTIDRKPQAATILFAIDGKCIICTAETIIHIIADHQQIFTASRKANAVKAADTFRGFFGCTFYLGARTILYIYCPVVVAQIAAGCVKTCTTQAVCQIFRFFL